MTTATALLRTETYKQTRRLRTYITAGFVVLVSVIIAVALKASPPTPGRDAGPRLFLFSLRSGLLLPAAALRVMNRFLLVIIAALFAGDTIAGEANWGNLRYLLVRPVRRGSLVLTKLSVSLMYAFIMTALVAISGLAIGIIVFGWHPLDVPSFGGAIHLSTTKLLGDVALSTVYIAWSLTFVVAFAVFISTVTDAPAGAIASGVGIYILSQILDAIEPLGSIRDGLPTHYFDAWVPLFAGQSVGHDMVRGTLLQIPYLLIFGGLAYWWFRRKDILS